MAVSEAFVTGTFLLEKQDIEIEIGKTEDKRKNIGDRQKQSQILRISVYREYSNQARSE
jgi:hypothetical protein